MIQIFISYVKEDIEYARRLYYQLKSIPSILPWLDEENILPGENWALSIKNAINESNFLIVIISSISLTKIGEFQRELKIAIDKLGTVPIDQIFIIPIRIEKCEIPAILKDNKLHYVDFFKNWDEGFRKMLKSINRSYENIGHYFGKIDRARFICDVLENVTNKYKNDNKEIIIRMRATLTSMSNIKHYQEKKIADLSFDQAKQLDILLEKERDLFGELLDLENVKLKCICWPRYKFLNKVYYSGNERIERFAALIKFLRNSLEMHSARRQILCDRAGMNGNQIIINNEIAITANPESGGYTKTSIFDEQQAIDILINEYDNLFNRIMKTKFDIGKVSINKRINEKLLLDTLIMADNEYEKLINIKENNSA